MMMKPGTLWLSLPVMLLCQLVLIPVTLSIEFQKALPGYRFEFPRDHASHPAFKTEWWYYTGHLKTREGKRYGYELTFFRVGTQPVTGKTSESPWSTNNVYAAHFALSDEGNRSFRFDEKLNRPGLQVAGARPDMYHVWNELWLAQQLGKQMVLRAGSTDGKREIHLLLTPEKAPVIHGRNGISQKASCTGCASHYYSMTRLKTEGFLIANGQAEPVSGLSWMDHEFGSNQLGKHQTGWDWFSVQLNDNTELMLYLLRQTDGRPDPNSSGTIVYADGRSKHLTLKDFQVRPSGKSWESPKTGGRYPMGWTVRVPSEQLELNLTPAFEEQELTTSGSTGVAYWEGSTHARGTHRSRPVAGEAYVEMTGYAERFQADI